MKKYPMHVILYNLITKDVLLYNILTLSQNETINSGIRWSHFSMTYKIVSKNNRLFLALTQTTINTFNKKKDY